MRRLGVDLDLLRRELEPRRGEPFDAQRSAKLDQAILGTEDADKTRRTIGTAEAIRKFLDRSGSRR